MLDANRAEPVEIWKARKLIAEFSDDQLSLTIVATSVHASANYFSEKFKRVTGVNFVRYVAEVRTRRAKDLLAHSDSRISEIAFTVGFQSLSQFNRVFRSLTLQSPSQFRAARRPSVSQSGAGKKAVRKVIGKNA